MAYGAKYRIEFKDFYDNDIKVDLLKDGYSGSVTSVTPTDDPLKIEWRGERSDLFKPVRGGLATLNVYAQTTDQFSEFFNATEKQFKMEVYVSASLYWTGYVMVGEHQQALLPTPYPVSFKAYDLGYLQDIEYDGSSGTPIKIIEVINACLSETGFGLNVKERVNIYEDSMLSASDDSPLEQAYVYPQSHLDDDHVGLSCYEVLERELLPLNAILMQESGVWNICRVPDMARSHYYRVFNSSSTNIDDGTEDTTTALSGVNIMELSGILMAAPSWKNLNFFQDHGSKNLIYNGNFDIPFTYTDFWTKTGAGLVEQVFELPSMYGGFEALDGGLLKVTHSGSPASTYVTYDTTFDVDASDNLCLYVTYNAMTTYGSGTGTPQLNFSIINDDGAGTFNYLQADGSWDSTALTYIDVTDGQYASGEIISDVFTHDGTVTVRLYAPTGISSPTSFLTYWKEFSVQACYRGTVPDYNDLSESISTSNLEEPSDIEVAHGDSQYGESGVELMLGNYRVSGNATSAWQSNAGSPEDEIQQLCADVYKAQHETTSKKIQGTVKGEIDYLDVLTDSDSVPFFPVSLTKHFAPSELQGEWIEIKTGWGDDITGTFINGYMASNQYDSFSTTSGEFDITKTTIGDNDLVTLSGTSVTAGTRYKICFTIIDNSGTSNLPQMALGGTSLTRALGYNEQEVIATTTQSVHNDFCSHSSGNLCDLTITDITIQEAYGL
jgi:hypothetical protein